MFGRLLREQGFVRKGPRGRNAPHTNSEELACFLIAIMASPDSPAIGVDRLPHLRALPLDPEKGTDITFGDALSRLLDRLSQESWEQASGHNWTVRLEVTWSNAEISETHELTDGPVEVEHRFNAIWAMADDTPVERALPNFSGLDVISELDVVSLYRIARVVLAGVADPLKEITETLQNTIVASGDPVG